MSFNASKVGEPICLIKGGEYDGTKIFLDKSFATEKSLKKSFTKLQLKEGHFQQIPNTKTEREIGMVVGASGSGKSYYIKNYCKEYKKVYPKRDIYMFSNLKEDETLKGLELNRIMIGDNLIYDPLDVALFRESLVLFDDIDCIKNKVVKDAVYSILNEVLEVGRHEKCSAIITMHYPNKSNIRTLLNEAHWFVYFPWSCIKATHYVLENYLGVDKENIKKIKATRSRACCVFRNYPQACLTEKMIFTMAGQDDDT